MKNPRFSKQQHCDSHRHTDRIALVNKNGPA